MKLRLRSKQRGKAGHNSSDHIVGASLAWNLAAVGVSVAKHPLVLTSFPGAILVLEARLVLS